MERAVSPVAVAVFFIVGVVISTIIIFVVTKLLGEREGVGTALSAALVGFVLPTVGDPP